VVFRDLGFRGSEGFAGCAGRAQLAAALEVAPLFAVGLRGAALLR
jgi:hypothetical protein